jgi:hypothetical protein
MKEVLYDMLNSKKSDIKSIKSNENHNKQIQKI